MEELVAAASAINGTLDPQRVAQVLAERVATLLEVHAVAVLGVDDRRKVRVLHSQGLSTNYAETEAGSLDQSIAGRALAESRTFAAWDVRQSADTRLAEVAQAEGIVSVAPSAVRPVRRVRSARRRNHRRASTRRRPRGIRSDGTDRT